MGGGGVQDLLFSYLGLELDTMVGDKMAENSKVVLGSYTSKTAAMPRFVLHIFITLFKEYAIIFTILRCAFLHPITARLLGRLRSTGGSLRVPRQQVSLR